MKTLIAAAAILTIVPLLVARGLPFGDARLPLSPEQAALLMESVTL